MKKSILPYSTGRVVKTALLLTMMAAALVFAGCQKKESADNTAGSTESAGDYSIGIFVPGVTEGNPNYEMLVAGTTQAAEEKSATVKIVEGGFNQGEWLNKLKAMSATGDYDLIVTANPAMPELCAQTSEAFPDQKYLVIDGYMKDNPAIATFSFKQTEQAFLSGHLAGLLTADYAGTRLKGINDDLKAGLIAGQEYPDMNNHILPGFEAGLRYVHNDGSVDFRIVGNWYDATKGAELAKNIVDGGADIILTIAGGANQGVLTAAEETGTYVLWYDSNGYSQLPGTVLGSTSMKVDRAAYEKTLEAIEGRLKWGQAVEAGIRDGYITFIDDDALYEEHVPQAVRMAQKKLLDDIKSGSFEIPQL